MIKLSLSEDIFNEGIFKKKPCPNCGSEDIFEIEDHFDAKDRPIWVCTDCKYDYVKDWKGNFIDPDYSIPKNEEMKEAFNPEDVNDIINAIADVRKKYDELRDAIYVLDAKAPEFKLDTLIWRLEDEFGVSLNGDLEDIEAEINNTTEE